MIRIQQSGNSVTFTIKVHPKARRERISGVLGDMLKLEITAPPLEGKANDACVTFFSDFLKVPRSSVTIASGAASRLKVVRISGITAEQLRRRLNS